MILRRNIKKVKPIDNETEKNKLRFHSPGPAYSALYSTKEYGTMNKSKNEYNRYYFINSELIDSLASNLSREGLLEFTRSNSIS